MANTPGLFTLRKTRQTVKQVDVIMRVYGYFTLAEMFRALIRKAYKEALEIDKNRKPEKL